MIRRFMMIVALFSGTHLVCYDKIIFKNLHSRYIRNFSKTNTTITEDRALRALEKISKNSSTLKIESILTNPVIKDLFSFELAPEESNYELYSNILGARSLVLLYLYDQMFQQYIISIESFLNSLLEAQKYWIYEDFCMNQSWMNKNIFYNFYSSQYHASIKRKIIVLNDIEQQVAYMLGVCLYGMTRIEKVKIEEQAIESVVQFVELFYQAYNTPLIHKENQKNPIRLYQDLIWINGNLQQHMQNAQKLLQENSKPSFLVEHTVATSCAAAALVMAVIIYKKYEQGIPDFLNRIKSLGKIFYKDYLVNPIYKIKEIVWDRKPATKMPKIILKEPIGKMPKIILKQPIGEIPELNTKLRVLQESEFPNSLGINGTTLGYSFGGIVGIEGNKAVDKVVKDAYRVVNEVKGSWNEINDFVNETTKEVINPVADGINGVIGYINDAGEVVVNPAIDGIHSVIDCINEAGDKVVNPMIESTELTLYLSMIVPAVLVGYFVIVGGYKGYKYYIRHENWYAPMRYIIRSIDQLLNKITRADDSPDFAEDGKLYMLVQHLKEYVSCLRAEELFLMNNDITELLSFDLNYHQKRGVVQRMYKTYEFLK